MLGETRTGRRKFTDFQWQAHPPILTVDEVAGECAKKYPACPFGCGKDSGPNCHQNIKDKACQPGKDYKVKY